MGLVFPLSAGRVNMRGLILLLPVLLVLFLAGSARTEEQSSLVEEAKLASNLLPLEEKVVERETREAEKQQEGKKNQKKKKKNAAGDKKGKKKAASKNKSERIQQRKKNRRLEKIKKNNGKKYGNRKAAGGKKESKTKKNQKKKKANRNRNKPRGKDARKKKKKQKKKKDKMKRRKSKNAGRQGPAGGDWSSCGASGVNDTCLLNAVNALNFEKNQIQNFFKQKARLENQNKVTGNKKGKKGEFEDAAKYMLTAIGGDISSPTCGENTTRSTRAAADAVATYNTLINCSASIHEACDMPNGTFNATCADIYNKSKVASDDCRSNSAYTSDGAAACNCWEKAAIGITIAKAEGCTKKGKEQAQAVKKQKQKCISAFSKCKKAEDAAVALIYTCMSGEVNTNASSAEKDLAKGPLLFV